MSVSSPFQPLEQLDAARFETPAVLKRLAELKGVAASIPNQGILISTLGLQEAKDSSEIENIVTTHDELFRGDLLAHAVPSPAATEVLRYREALRVGFDHVRASGLITNNHLIDIQAALEHNQAGFRRSQDLVNNLFTHPYTKIEHVQRDLQVSRLTASKYLDALAAGGFVRKLKVGRSNYYVNLALNAVLTAGRP